MPSTCTPTSRRFAELPDRTAVEQARGSVLVMDVDPDELPEEDDEYYDRQLVGLEAVLADGTVVGLVSQVMHMPAQDVLAIATTSGERLVPFVSELVPSVVLAAGLGFWQLRRAQARQAERAVVSGVDK